MNTQTRRFYFNRKLLIFSNILLTLLFAFSTQAFAADFTVNLTTDQHDVNLADQLCDVDTATAGEQCSLRAAVEQFHRFPLFTNNDRILFNLPAKSTITLTTENGGEIHIFTSRTLGIIGTGADNLTIDGGPGLNRIFLIDSSPVVISGVTLTGGNGVNRFSNGESGGAINSYGGPVTLDRVHVIGNSSLSTVGGVFFSGRAQNPNRIINSTISGNTAGGCGGIGNFNESSLIIVNSTISGNTAQSGSGGGICNAGNIVLRNSTITSNAASDSGGGIVNAEGTINFGNTIIAGNTSTRSVAPEILFLGGTITSAGGNLVGDSPGDSTNTNVPSFPNPPLINYQSTDKRDINPMLGALANNGGQTPTHALLTGSPLIDAGLNDVAVDPAMFDPILPFDQRGAPFRRIADGNGDGSAIVDIGAFERINASGSRTMFDFDGDGRADIAVFRPSNGFWYVLKSTGGFSAVQWGLGTDRLVPGDYDGDGKTDVAVYRPGPRSLGYGDINENAWHIRRSSDNAFLTRQYGKNGVYEWDTSVPADYDGDGKTDLGLYALIDVGGAGGSFKVWQSSDGARYEARFGSNIDRIVPRDYDGDGKADLATARIEPRFSSNGLAVWQILQSSNGATKEVQFGLATDKFVPADYDGDGKADIAVYRQSEGFWYRLNSSDGSFYAERFGASEDKPVPADYDGDGKTDIAVFRPSNGTWYLQQSKEGFAAKVFGFADDIPIPNVYVR